MKPVFRAIGWVLLLLAANVVLLTGSTAFPSDTEKILASERAWAQAAVKGDASSMAKFMADDYVELATETVPGTTTNKWTNTSKAEWIDLVRSGREKYASVDLRNFKVYFHGDVATVTAEYSQTGTKDGKDVSGTGFYVDTWVKKNGNWQLVSSVFP